MLSYSTYISIQDTHISVLPRVKDILKLKSGPIPSLPPPASPLPRRSEPYIAELGAFKVACNPLRMR